MNPCVYILYCLQFKDDLSPNQVLQQWKEDDLGTLIYHHSLRFSTNKHLPSLDYESEVIGFIKKYKHKNNYNSFISVILGGL